MVLTGAAARREQERALFQRFMRETYASLTVEQIAYVNCGYLQPHAVYVTSVYCVCRAWAPTDWEKYRAALNSWLEKNVRFRAVCLLHY